MTDKKNNKQEEILEDTSESKKESLGDQLRRETVFADNYNHLFDMLSDFKHDLLVEMLHDAAMASNNYLSCPDSELYYYLDYETDKGEYPDKQEKDIIQNSLKNFARDNNLTLEIKPELDHTNYVFSW